MGYAIAQAPPYPATLTLASPSARCLTSLGHSQSDRLCSQAPAPSPPFYLERAFDPPPPYHPHPQNWLVPGATGSDSGQTAFQRISLISFLVSRADDRLKHYYHCTQGTSPLGT
ncbi:hypothetical protein B0H14DRAFT_2571378 [Mycena olivaceomarginata]|nr:hypothetical protein B0H14DRAFT_2571378 [Mycena olivaceomarginata]